MAEQRRQAIGSRGLEAVDKNGSASREHRLPTRAAGVTRRREAQGCDDDADVFFSWLHSRLLFPDPTLTPGLTHDSINSSFHISFMRSKGDPIRSPARGGESARATAAQVVASGGRRGAREREMHEERRQEQEERSLGKAISDRSRVPKKRCRSLSLVCCCCCLFSRVQCLSREAGE